MKARISQLHRTEAAWNKLSNFVPEAGELIVYDKDDVFDYARIKVGDGATALNDLPFFIDSTAQAVLQKHKFDTVIDGGRVTDFK